MCTPEATLGMQVGGAFMEGIGAYSKASGTKSYLKSEANAAELNARVAELQGQDALRQGQRQEQASRIESANLKSSQVAAYGGRNIDLASETAIRVMTSTDVLGEIDANTIAANAGRAAFGYKMQGVQYQNEAMTKRASAKGISPFTAASTSLINSFGDVSMSWYRLKKSGAKMDAMDAVQGWFD